MFSPDGSRIAARGERRTLVWDCDTEELLWEREGQPLAFAPDGRHIAVVRRREVIDGVWREGRLWLCDSATGKSAIELEEAMACFDRHGLLLTVTRHPVSVAAGPARNRRIDLPKTPEVAGTISFSSDGKLLALEDARSSWVSLWDVEDRTQLWSRGPYGVDTHVGDTVELTFSPDGSLLVIELDFSTKRTVLEARTGKELLRFDRRAEWFDAWLALSADGRAAEVTAEGPVRLWSLRSRQVIRTLPAWGTIRSVAFSADPNVLALGREDGEVSLWRPGADRSVEASKGRVTFLAFAPDGERLAAVRPEGISLICL